MTNISFPEGLGHEGTAYATGVVHGKVVYGKVSVQADPAEVIAAQRAEEGDDEGGEGATNSTDPDIRPGDEDGAARYNDTEAGEGLDPVDAQYQSAIRQVVGNMKQRTSKMASDATKIAKAVTKVLTSSAVSDTIADMAWSLAEKKFGGGGAVVPPADAAQRRAGGGGAGAGEGLDAAAWMRQSAREGGVGRLSGASPRPEVGGAFYTPGGGVSSFMNETFAESPAAGAYGPRAGGFGNATGLCAGCLICPGCCSNGWVPGCRAYKEPSDGAEDWGSKETVGQLVAKQTLFDPDVLKREYQAIDQRWKKDLRTIQSNAAGQERQQQLAREVERERRRRQRAAAARAQRDRQRQRKEQQAEYVPLENIAAPEAGGELGDPAAAFRSYERTDLGYAEDASARFSNTKYSPVY